MRANISEISEMGLFSDINGFSFSGFGSLLSGKYRKNTVAQAVFIEEHPYEKGFAVHYMQHVKPHVTEFEESRRAALDKASSRAKISLPLIALAIVGTVFLVGATGEVDFWILGLAAFLALVGWVFMPLARYSSSVKYRIFPNIVSFVEGFQFSPSCANRAHTLKRSDIIPNYDLEHSEDRVQGTYKGVEIDLSETRLQRKRRSHNRSDYVDVFKGVLITLSSNKKFAGKTVVRKDGGTVGNWFKSKTTSLERVALEDPRFERMFEVYSDDQVEARYLLTTSFMDRLLRLGRSFGGKHVECSFFDDKLLMKIAVKRNLFEAGSVFEPEDFVDDAKQFLEDVNLIFAIIETLKLDQDIGM